MSPKEDFKKRQIQEAILSMEESHPHKERHKHAGELLQMHASCHLTIDGHEFVFINRFDDDLFSKTFDDYIDPVNSSELIKFRGNRLYYMFEGEWTQAERFAKMKRYVLGRKYLGAITKKL